MTLDLRNESGQLNVKSEKSKTNSTRKTSSLFYKMIARLLVHIID